MKLSEQTREVLKNFSTINQNLLVKPGKTLTTMSAMKTLLRRQKLVIHSQKNLRFMI